MPNKAKESQSTFWIAAKTWLESGADGADEALVDSYAGKVFHYWRLRNAYHRTLVETFHNDHAFHPGFDEIVQRVESAREPGAKWIVEEVPVLVVRGSTAAVVIAAMKDGRPAGSLGDELPSDMPLTLGELATQWSSSTVSTAICFVAGANAVPEITSQLKLYKSQPVRGREVPLRWKATRVTRGVLAARRQAAAWQSRFLSRLNDCGEDAMR